MLKENALARSIVDDTRERDKERGPEMHPSEKGAHRQFNMDLRVGADMATGLVQTVLTVKNLIKKHAPATSSPRGWSGSL